jgi:hypothetical protein
MWKSFLIFRLRLSPDGNTAEIAREVGRVELPNAGQLRGTDESTLGLDYHVLESGEGGDDNFHLRE